MADEQTLILVKPDGVQRGLISKIMERFEQKGFRLVGAKFCRPDEKLLQEHYKDLASKGFFKDLIAYMRSGPIFATVWEGRGACKTARNMLGETNPADSKPGTIRGDYCIEVGRNICHASDSTTSARREIDLWFKPEELISWKMNSAPWLYENAA